MTNGSPGELDLHPSCKPPRHQSVKTFVMNMAVIRMIAMIMIFIQIMNDDDDGGVDPDC